MSTEGVLEVHGNVTLKANTAGDDGGAVSLPLEIGFHLTILIFCDILCESRFDSLRRLTKPCLKG